MIEMHVGAITVDETTGAPIVLLSDADRTRALPIWVGLPEARAISLAVQHVSTPRPLTHELLLSVITAAGYKLKQVSIDKIVASTYTASLVLTKTGRARKKDMIVDARPSDAIALALTARVPMFVAPDVADKGCVRVELSTRDEDELKFKEFLKDVRPSDFKLDVPVELPPDDDDPGVEG